MEGSKIISSNDLQVFELTPDNNGMSEWETWLESQKDINEKEVQALKSKVVKFRLG